MQNFIEHLKLPDYLIPVSILVSAAFLVHFVALRYFLGIFKILSKKTSTHWDDLLVERKVINRAIHLIPATILSFGVPLIFDKSTDLYGTFSRFLSLYYILVSFGIYEALINTIRDGYDHYEVSNRVSIRGFLQAFKLIGLLFCLVLAISQLAGKSPVYFISGLGAFTAVLLLIFKDSLLGLVAGIQLTTMDLVRKGDWIEMPKHSADGDVIDISLTTVRVRNWDMTISAIPAYELISSSFKNWRGMSESGGRRIKRSIVIDLNTIRFLNIEDIERLNKIKYLRTYLEGKLPEIKHANEIDFSDSDLSILVNGRRLTNIGTFRAYCVAYLRNHTKTHQGLIQMVRQLEPGAQGLPLELYVFTNDVRWGVYESIQADIFDHLLAILPEFGLRAFQSLSGADIREGFREGFTAIASGETGTLVG